MRKTAALIKLAVFLSTLFISACDEQAWNDPYPQQSATANTIYTAFVDEPKHLDPAQSYSEDEWLFISQIYEPVISYKYLERPYELQPLTAAVMPDIKYNAKTNTTTYTIHLKKDILYQPHPAFAKNADGAYLYHNLTQDQALKFSSIADFKETGTRELKAMDYVNQIKRLADPSLNSPIFGFLGPVILGLKDLRTELQAQYADNPNVICLDLRSFDLKGAQVIDDHTFEIVINGQYAQFIYWLEMLFFSPVPWEANKFYCQKGLAAHNINLDTYPVGTGPFYLAEINPQRRIVMQNNPHFHPEFYPSLGTPEDIEKGLLKNAGRRLPMVDQLLFSLEREGIPYWDKFNQGYYDRSRIGSTTFNSAMNQTSGSLQLSPELLERGVTLNISDTLSCGYWGFNMLDEVVGGYSEQARQLRTAISLAFDMEEFILIFLNGRAKVASSPIPPGILGYTPTPEINLQKNLTEAKRLLSAAGYPNGISKATGKRLQINYDCAVSGSPERRAFLGWVEKQFAKLGIDLIIRGSDYSRFQDKVRNGQVQFYDFGWNLDYPDPENSLFLFYGPNARVVHNGENTSNYDNPEFNKLFMRFKELGVSGQRLPLIEKMLAILDKDKPWIWGYFPQDYVLANPWYSPMKPSAVSTNVIKYAAIDSEMRAKLRMKWNQPIIWPLVLTIIICVLLMLPAVIGYLQSRQARAKRIK